MSLEEQLKSLDKKYDQVVEMWGEEIKSLCQNEKIKPDSRKFEKMVSKINDKYAEISSDILLEREDVYAQLAKEQNEAYFAQFSDPKKEAPTAIVDENWRPIGKKCVNGEWVDVDVKK